MSEPQTKYEPSRQDFIGSTDAGVIAGVDPYKSVLELYHEKKGDLTPEVIDDKPAVHFGKVLEGVIAEEYARRTGTKVRRVNQHKFHKDLTWMAAQIDRDIVASDRQLECKTAGFMQRDTWGPDGSDEVPERYLLQCQHALAVTGNVLCDLAVLIGGQDFRVYPLPRDESIIDNLITLEVQFWERLQSGHEPALDMGRPEYTWNLMRRLFPGTNGETITLSVDAVDLHRSLLNVSEKRKMFEASEKGIKATLLSMMGEAAVGLLPDDAGQYTRKLVSRKGYEVKPMEYIDFRFKRVKP